MTAGGDMLAGLIPSQRISSDPLDILWHYAIGYMPDFLDGKGKGVDHYGPRNFNVADDVAALHHKLTLQSYEVYFDGSAITAAQEQAIIRSVLQQLTREGRPTSLITRVISERAPGGLCPERVCRRRARRISPRGCSRQGW